VLDLSIRKNGEISTHVAMGLMNLAGFAHLRGDTVSAMDLGHRAVEVDQKARGARNPMASSLMLNYATLLARVGRRGAALDSALRAEALGWERLRSSARTLSEGQALAYALVRPTGLKLALSLAAD